MCSMIVISIYLFATRFSSLSAGATAIDIPGGWGIGQLPTEDTEESRARSSQAEESGDSN